LISNAEHSAFAVDCDKQWPSEWI